MTQETRSISSSSDGRNKIRSIKRWIIFLPCFLLMSCARPGGYDGMMKRSYTVRGQRYHPMSVDAALAYQEVGVASWFNESKWFGLVRGNTSLGEKVMPWHLIAAHKTLPLPCVVKVTNLENGKSVKVRVNDRGPFIDGRLIDLSPRAAAKIEMKDRGLARVKVEVLSVGDGAYKHKARRGFW
jgi:rare lipoprotein A